MPPRTRPRPARPSWSCSRRRRWTSTAAAEAARPLVGPETLVLSIQNGLGGPDAAAAVLGDDRVAVGVVGGFGASVVAPGHVHHHGFELVRLGERSGPGDAEDRDGRDVWRRRRLHRPHLRRRRPARLGEARLQRRLQRDVLGARPHDRRGDRGRARVVGRVAAAPSRRTRWRGRWGSSSASTTPSPTCARSGSAIPGAKPSMLLDLEAGRPTRGRLHQRRDSRGSGRERRRRRAVQRGGQRARAGARARSTIDVRVLEELRVALRRRPRHAAAGRAGRLRVPGHARGARRRRRVAARRAHGRPARPSRSCASSQQGEQVVQDDTPRAPSTTRRSSGCSRPTAGSPRRS